MEKVGSGRSAVEPKNLPVILDATTQPFLPQLLSDSAMVSQRSDQPFRMGMERMIKDLAPEECLDAIVIAAQRGALAVQMG